MIQETIESFKVVAPLLVPEMFSVNNLQEIDIREEEAVITYNVRIPISYEEILNQLEDQMEFILLYSHQASSCTEFGKSCCAYSNPQYGHMFKINVSTNANGMCDTVYVSIYDSLDYMCHELVNELRLKSKHGSFLYNKEDTEVLSDFF